ncbi:MAG: polyphenol oxidase family protein [Actinobacteria bacterium]|nr:polyphenol oxidase family protein [Actinomycetota bacterium]
MIVGPGREGAAFTDGGDGDVGKDLEARRAVSSSLGISPEWATVRQVHGSRVFEANSPGALGEGDALWTTEPGLPLAILTADCLGVVLHARGAVGVAHAGWRGAAAGVVAALRGAMTAGGASPHRASIGPGIRACCFEVGDEVAGIFPGRVAATSWGTTSVDLVAAVRDQLDDVKVWSVGRCTFHDDGMFSHRRERTESRMAAIGWLP